jgi:hypothetical protein
MKVLERPELSRGVIVHQDTGKLLRRLGAMLKSLWPRDSVALWDELSQEEGYP